jgi:excisionase family DNA binding protein
MECVQVSNAIVETDIYLSTGAVAREFGVSPKTVQRWAKLGRIASIVTLGGHRRFEREEIERVRQSMVREAKEQ